LSIIKDISSAYYGGLKVKQPLGNKINLLELEGKGDFLCPSCGTIISPNDETEEVYSILEAKVKDNILEGLLIRCNNCSNKILLTGFAVLETT
jgi:DNA-directed RNA polymerase subunit RPC12/RpoP